MIWNHPDRERGGDTINLSSEKGSKIDDGSCEKEWKHTCVDIFTRGEFETFYKNKEHSEESKNSAHKWKIKIIHKEEFNNPFIKNKFIIPPLRKNKENSWENEHWQKKRKSIWRKEIRVDTKFNRKLVEHSKEQEKTYHERESKYPDGNSKNLKLREHNKSGLWFIERTPRFFFLVSEWLLPLQGNSDLLRWTRRFLERVFRFHSHSRIQHPQRLSLLFLQRVRKL